MWITLAPCYPRDPDRGSIGIPEMAKDHEYLVELRKEHAGGKVTVYRNRDWILQALSEGFSKRAIYDALREREGLTIGYSTFAKHVQKWVIDDRKPQTPSAAMPDKRTLH